MKATPEKIAKLHCPIKFLRRIEIQEHAMKATPEKIAKLHCPIFPLIPIMDSSACKAKLDHTYYILSYAYIFWEKNTRPIHYNNTMK